MRKGALGRWVCGAGDEAGLCRQAGGRSGGGCVEPSPAGWIRTEQRVALLGPRVIAASSCEAAVIHGWGAEGQGVRGMARSAGRGASHYFCNELG